jgi:hypothetical protein
MTTTDKYFLCESRIVLHFQMIVQAPSLEIAEQLTQEAGEKVSVGVMRVVGVAPLDTLVKEISKPEANGMSHGG